MRVVLVRPQQAGNVGAAARAVANHGLAGLVLVDPPAFDPDLARWMAPGAREIVDAAPIVATVADAVSDCALVVGTTARRRRYHWPVWGPAELRAEVWPVDRPPARIALVFGPEDAGLSTADLGSCHALFCLPTGAHRSLNLAQAVMATLAGLSEGPAEGPAPAGEAAAPPFDLDAHRRVVERALRVLGEAGYLSGRNPTQVAGTLTRLLGRARADGEEAAVLLGMLEQASWALRDRRGG